jgi:hypothetical protein
MVRHRVSVRIVGSFRNHAANVFSVGGGEEHSDSAHGVPLEDETVRPETFLGQMTHRGPHVAAFEAP